MDRFYTDGPGSVGRSGWPVPRKSPFWGLLNNKSNLFVGTFPPVSLCGPCDPIVMAIATTPSGRSMFAQSPPWFAPGPALPALLPGPGVQSAGGRCGQAMAPPRWANRFRVADRVG